MGISDIRKCACLMDNLLVFLTFIGVATGIIIGILVRQAEPSQDTVIWIALPGDVFMGSLKMVVLPLIVTSVITGTASLDPKCNGTLSMVSLGYIFITNSVACILPMVIVIVVRPGKDATILMEDIGNEGITPVETIDVFSDLIRNLFPSNMISACFEQFQTKYKNVSVIDDKTSGSNDTLNSNQTEQFSRVKYLGTVPSTNVLGLVIFSFILGLATSSIGPAGQAFYVFFRSANAVVMKVLGWLVWMTPLGVASLIAGAFLKVKHVDNILSSLGLFCITTIGCLVLHMIILTIVIHLVILRANPFPFLASLTRVITVTFATTSSAMAMPSQFEALEERNKIDSRVTRFTIPLAATISREFSSIFIAISCVFLAEISGKSVNAAQAIAIWALIVFICMAIPSVPSGSLVVVTIILSSLGIPANWVGLLFATEWILDRVRSCANAVSHSYCTLVVAHFCRNALPPMKESPEDELLQPSEKTLVIDKTAMESTTVISRC